MPGRPPKKWMRDCVAGAKRSGSAVDPGAVCGAQWHHKMSKKQKAAAMRRSERRKRNPAGKGFFSSPLVWIVGGGGLAFLAYRMWGSGASGAPAVPGAPGGAPLPPGSTSVSFPPISVNGMNYVYDATKGTYVLSFA